MTHVLEKKSTAKVAAGVAVRFFLSTLAVLGLLSVSVPASADDHRGGDRRGDDHRDHRDWDHHRRGWSGGYYAAPPVVYGNPYYAPPPVVYGPTIGIRLW